uniref:Phosphatase and actin regulator n=1 Tax=Lates calcarifer TaxID=8187 RepID=A0A4W6EPQ9_LATCA
MRCVDFSPLSVCEPLSWRADRGTMEEEEAGDTYRETRHFPLLWPLPRLRSQSDASGFRSRVLFRLRGARSVDGLEKSSSLASCDVVVDSATSTQNAPASRQQRGKLSSLGKLFKPWKWRKKKTSDKFQDLSKVLERKISTRQTREELIRKGVLIPDQDEPISSENLNGHATSSVTSEEVKVDIESPETPLEEQATGPVSTEDKTDAAAALQTNGTDAKTNRKSDTPISSSVPQKASAETASHPGELKPSTLSSDTKPASSKASGNETEGAQAASQSAPNASTVGEETHKGAAPEATIQSPHINAATQDTSFTEGETNSSSQGEKRGKWKRREERKKRRKGKQFLLQRTAQGQQQAKLKSHRA